MEYKYIESVHIIILNTITALNDDLWIQQTKYKQRKVTCLDDFESTKYAKTIFIHSLDFRIYVQWKWFSTLQFCI